MEICIFLHRYIPLNIDTCQRWFGSTTIMGYSNENHLNLPKGIYSIEEGVSKYFAVQDIPDQKCKK